jgi:hypothetical protein
VPYRMPQPDTKKPALTVVRAGVFQSGRKRTTVRL